ncbi:uncharacterized protein NECHADRAFT_85229 [Fusarium vanettenii 77-13-4]|uniref:Uncharacterized protein n=1 Tax=Fusarium vanettenii (strain ATCC MYA-4622 / CBS 123669 / FGSC 9596 / NRRL 45880 / 77-13-4) TaxID=660122 RepID=C7YVC7_FUSV7|nr:uncharacterized protein NECHADRAFT_85229 [Fusarium vanettenii 77-13-4]EEU44561.1 hypothetical protein NECHADRAFT_85229 [Fusarium vanettenii 77-13-4]
MPRLALVETVKSACIGRLAVRRFAIIHASWNSRKTACELFGISPLSPCMTVLLSDDIFSQNRSTLIISVDMKEHNVDGNLLPSNSVACSVDARWANAKTVMEMTANTQLDHEYTLGRVRNLVETDLPFSHLIGYYRWKPPPMPVVRMSPSWYDLLAPVLPDAQSSAAAGLPWMPASGSKQTALEAVLSMTYKPVDSGQTEFEGLLATTLADGLSRCGLIPNHNGSRFLEAWQFGAWDTENEDQARTMIRKGNPVESFPEPSILKSGNMTRMEMKATYKGYVMSATGWFDYLSIAALLFHAIIALLHTILVVYHGKTSGAWDTILELVILTQMSSPPQESLLVNASAGIRSFKTVKLVAWVEAPQQGGTGHESGRELQMRFRDHMDHRDANLKPSVGKVYGSSVTEDEVRRLHRRKV